MRILWTEHARTSFRENGIFPSTYKKKTVEIAAAHNEKKRFECLETHRTYLR